MKTICNLRRILFLFFCALLLIRPTARAEGESFSPLIEVYPNGKTDWGEGCFYGTGKGYPHLNGGSRARALRTAQAGALSAILQVAMRIRVDEGRTLQDLARERGLIRLEGLVFYEPFDRKFIERGDKPHYRVTYRAPMRGVKGLTKKILPHLMTVPPGPPESLQPESDDLSGDAGPWLLLDARGLPPGSAANPALFPRILSETGETVSDLNTVEEGALIRRGMAQYVVSDRDPRKTGFGPRDRRAGLLERLLFPSAAWAEEKKRRKKRGRYIVAEVKGAEGLMKTNLVISESDAKELRKEDASNRILRQCRVLVVVSSSLGGIEGSIPDHLALRR